MDFHFLTEITDKNHLKNTALLIDDQEIKYTEFLEGAYYIAAFLRRYVNKQTFCITISEKTTFFYQMVMGCFLGSIVYTPLNVDAGLSRNLAIIETVKEAVLFLGDVSYQKVIDVIAAVRGRIIFVKNPELYARLTLHCRHNKYFLYEENDSSFKQQEKKIPKNDIAYLLFTSGSTGKPKAVPITHDNINAYAKSFLALFPATENDRFSQISDIGFDISIHEMIICWIVGATLCVYHEKNFLNLCDFIQKNAITQLILIPSMLNQLIMQSFYFKTTFSLVKRTIACGEPFPISYAKKWSKIALNSSIVNFYGPTEATISCLYHSYNALNNYSDKYTLPIGFPFPGTDAYLSSDDEIIVSGDQVSKGYLFLDKKSDKNKKFFKNDRHALSYATGDQAYFDPNFGFIFKGRLDDQWQVKGYRVEKNEVENIIKKIVGCEEICVAPHLNQDGLIDYLCSFSTYIFDFDFYRPMINKALNNVICPKAHYFLDKMPTLSNGKINYQALSNYKME